MFWIVSKFWNGLVFIAVEDALILPGPNYNATKSAITRHEETSSGDTVIQMVRGGWKVDR